MAHDIQTAAYSNEPAWHGLGTVIPYGMALDQAFALASLDWEVQAEPLYRYTGPDRDTLERLDDRVALVRQDNGARLGLVGNRYEPFQNSDLRDLAEAMMELDPSSYVESAMSLGQGEDVVLCIRLREWNIQGGDDKSVSYLVLWNSHNGTKALTTYGTDIRVVCRNTLTWSANKAERSTVGIRHTAGIHQAADALVRAAAESVQASESWEETANRLATWSLSGSEAGHLAVKVSEAIMGRVTDREAAQDDESSQRAARRREKLVQDIGAAWRHGASGALQGTAWDLFNRATGYLDHDSRIRLGNGESALERRDRNRIDPASLTNARKRSIRQAFETALAS
jgi:phage/plasmid-like protein (TIGR03299 family)